MVKGVWTFEVPEEKQKEYLENTAKIIKPFWESHECRLYQVLKDYTHPRRFVKEQYYPDKETMERSLALAKEDPNAQAVVATFRKYAENVVRMRCVPVIDQNGLIDG
jgi:hypothetical protein